MRAMRSANERAAVHADAVRHAKQRADDAYRRCAAVHRELEEARRLAARSTHVDPEVEERIARLQDEEDRLFAEAGQLWRAYTIAQCEHLWNSGDRSLLPRSWLTTVRRAQRLLARWLDEPRTDARGSRVAAGAGQPLRLEKSGVSAGARSPTV